MEGFLSVKGLSFGYRGKTVLHDIGFSVERGSLCGLLGPNASGKTTLLKCVNGVLNPASGRVSVDGAAIGGMTRRQLARLMAVVPQQISLAFSFTALQMVVMGRAARMAALELPSSRDREQARAAMAELGVEPLAERLFNELSGGERQLVLLARALFQETPVLLLDEPTSHLDFRNQYLIMDVVSRLTREKGLATLVTLHDPNLAARYCTHLAVLREGRLHRAGPLEAVFKQETLEEAYGMDVVVNPLPGGASVVLPAPRREAR